MMTDFLFWVILTAVLIATVQDLKRREVDNWLNFLLFLSGVVFIVFSFIFSLDFSFLIQGFFVIFLGFVFANVFYYGRVFAGGDAKLLLAMSPYFIGFSFIDTFVNFFVFVFCLFLCGSFYGLFYSMVLYFKDLKKSNEKIKVHLIKIKFWWFVIIGIFLLFFYFINRMFLFLGIFTIIFPFLFSFAKGLEEAVSYKFVKGSELREGDWLAEDVKVGKKIIKASFEGVSNEEIKILKNKKKIKIKEGIPFVPSFLFGFLVYYFYSDVFIRVVYNALINFL